MQFRLDSLTQKKVLPPPIETKSKFEHIPQYSSIAVYAKISHGAIYDLAMIYFATVNYNKTAEFLTAKPRYHNTGCESQIKLCTP